MGLIRTVAIVVLSISSIVFVALFGRLPVFRVLWVHIPGFIVGIDDFVTGRRITNSLRWFFHYLMHEAHPLVLIFFVSLQVIGEILYIPPALEYISPWPHYLTIPIAVVLPHITLYLSATTLSTVNASNFSECVAAYPYDYIHYHPHMPCETCKFPKPARSKHCSICKVCVQRQDHHCVWINNCVGRNNYGYFLLLLATIALLLGYASFLGHSILNSVTQDRYVPPALTRGSLTAKHWSTKLTWMQYLDAWSLTITLYPRIGATMLLSMLCFPLSLGFLAFHAYLIWAGMTTNESAKWAYLREDIYDDIVFKAKISEMKSDYPEPLDGGVNPGAIGWKVPSEWWFIRTRRGQHPTRRVVDEYGKEIPEAEEADDRWIRVMEMNEVVNVYDLGFKDNFKDGIFNRGGRLYS